MQWYAQILPRTCSAFAGSRTPNLYFLVVITLLPIVNSMGHKEKAEMAGTIQVAN
jgi:hypothetical protein